MVAPPQVAMPSLSPRAKRLLIGAAVIVVAVILWFQFVGVYVDFAWYNEISATQVFYTQLWTRVVLFAIAAVLGFAAVFGALLMAYRSRPVFVPTGEVDPLAPYRTLISQHPKTIAFGISGVVGLICGLAAQNSWQTVQLWMHGGNFNSTDPEFGLDVGFYMFRLPVIQMVLGWLFAGTVLAFIAVLVTQYIFSGIRLNAGKHRKVTAQAAFQLSLLVGIFVLVKAVQYWFDRYDLLFSERSGIFTGASYTDVHAVLVAKIILMIIAALCAIGFIVGGFMKSIKLPVIALALLVLSGAVVGGVWPLILQRVVVEPSQITREAPYIERNIEATRAAYGIGEDKVDFVAYDSNKGVVDPADLAVDAGADVSNAPGIVKNARLLDPNLLNATFIQQQQQRNFYGFSKNLSVDRYAGEDGVMRDYIVAAREIAVGNFGSDQQGWINQHLVYTHGDGFVAAQANTIEDGWPVFEVTDLASTMPGAEDDADGTEGAPAESFLPVEQTRIYYGALAPSYAVVGGGEDKQAREYDTDTTQYTYDGRGGVPVGGLFGRSVFATHYGEANFLFSSEINSDSKILYNRNPRDRVKKAAPFLTTDTRPYPAIVDGRIVWIVDAYTTAKNYPYAETIALSDATDNSVQATRGAAMQPDRQISYIRNSVKAVVDAYDGTVTLYQVADDDPVLEAWKGVFPGLITPESDVSEDLRAHFRYPEDLFEIQRNLIGKYYVSSPQEFYQSSNFWKVPNDPTQESVQKPQPPYYLEIALPGEEKPQFVLTSAMTWFAREYISAYVTAGSDPDHYGKLTVQQLPPQRQTPGPVLVQQLFKSNNDISNYIATRIAGGNSKVLWGNLLTLPTDRGLLYVEPLYQESTGSDSAYPQFSQALVWYNGSVGMGPTLAAALKNAHKVDMSVVDDDGTVVPTDAPVDPTGDLTDSSTAPPDSTDSQSVPTADTGSTTTATGTTSPPAPEGDLGGALDQLQQQIDAMSSNADAMASAVDQLRSALESVQPTP